MIEKKPFVVLDLLCGDGQVAHAVKDRIKDRPLKYIGIDDKRYKIFGKKFDWPTGPEFTFHASKIDFSTEEKLKAKLDELLQGEKADEIYLNMPDIDVNVTPPHVLKLIHAALKPGGRFYHMVDSDCQSAYGQLRDLHPPTGDKPKRVFEMNKQRIKARAEPLGFKLDKYGVKSYSDKTGNEYWYTGPKRNKTAKRKTDEVVEKHTGYPLIGFEGPYLMHFIIAKKVE